MSPVNLTETCPPAFSWKSQMEQYPEFGDPGISYFKGDLSANDWYVDCLLYRSDEGRLIGILNHYPQDLPGEDEGNINIWVDPAEQRKGIGTALVDEAVRLYDVNFDQQRYTAEGVEFFSAYLNGKNDGSTPEPVAEPIFTYDDIAYAIGTWWDASVRAADNEGNAS